MNENKKIYDIISIILQFHKSIGIIHTKKLVSLIYLCDWKSSIDHGKTITNIPWKYLNDNYTEHIAAAFDIGKIEMGQYNFDENFGTLTAEEIEVVNYISQLSIELKSVDFMKLVFSTFPMLTQDRYKDLNLPELASDYIENYAFV